MTLYDELSQVKNFKRYKGEFGLELETEGIKPYDQVAMGFWSVHKDDSLRGPDPREYVLKQPLLFEGEIPAALDEFDSKTKLADAKFKQDSFTTSVHTHVNMLNESILTMGNFLTVYVLFENLLKKYAGPSRESNLFCLPICDAEENLTNITYILERIKNKKFGHLELDQGNAKYAALNMCSLWKFGSLEIRLLRGTTDMKIVHTWLSMLHHLLKFSRQNITPKEIFLSLKNKGVKYLEDAIGLHRDLLKMRESPELIEQNFWYAANIAMTVPDWKLLDNPRPLKMLGMGDLDKLCMEHFGKIFDELPEDKKHLIIKNFKYIGEGQIPPWEDAPAGGAIDQIVNLAQVKPKKKVGGVKPVPLPPGGAVNPFIVAANNVEIEENF